MKDALHFFIQCNRNGRTAFRFGFLQNNALTLRRFSIGTEKWLKTHFTCRKFIVWTLLIFCFPHSFSKIGYTSNTYFANTRWKCKELKCINGNVHICENEKHMETQCVVINKVCSRMEKGTKFLKCENVWNRSAKKDICFKMQRKLIRVVARHCPCAMNSG